MAYLSQYQQKGIYIAVSDICLLPLFLVTTLFLFHVSFYWKHSNGQKISTAAAATGDVVVVEVEEEEEEGGRVRRRAHHLANH